LVAPFLSSQIDAARLKEEAGIQEWLRAQEAAAAQSLKSVNDRIQGLQDESAAADLAQQQNISLAQAIEQVIIVCLKEQEEQFQ
jgi:hypothetical protein